MPFYSCPSSLIVEVNSKRKIFDPRSKYTGQKFCMVQFLLWSLKCFVALAVVNLNIETEKFSWLNVKIVFY